MLSVLSVLAERRLQQGQNAELGLLLDEVLTPPIERVGAMDIDDFLSLKDRSSLPGTKHLRALVVFDECYGLLPPHPANLPTKRPTVALMKQGRAFGVGVIVATQNPMDLDYHSLANANEPGSTAEELSKLIRRLSPYLRGPMTLGDIRRAVGRGSGVARPSQEATGIPTVNEL